MSDKPSASAQQPSGEAPLPPAQTSGLAVASLVCGIVGFITCGLAGLVGLILGIGALVRIADNPLKRKGGGLAVAGICVSVASLLTFLAIALAMVMSASTRGGRVPGGVCRSNLRQVGMAVLMYANDNQDVLPENLADVVGEGYGTSEMLVCPDDTNSMRIGGYPCSFYYLGDLSISEVDMVADVGNLIIVYEDSDNHKYRRNKYRRNVLRLNGGAVQLEEPAFREWMRDNLEKVKAMDSWPDLPEERKREIEAFYTPEQTE